MERRAAHSCSSRKGARVPVPYGVGATLVGQFHTRAHYKTAMQSEFAVSQGLFSQCLR